MSFIRIDSNIDDTSRCFCKYPPITAICDIEVRLQSTIEEKLLSSMDHYYIQEIT